MIYTDHEALKYFGTKQLLNNCQAWWSELIFSFNYNIIYYLRKLNLLTDTLSQKTEDLQTQKVLKQKHQIKTLLDIKHIIALIKVSLEAELDIINQVLTANRSSESL